jgi:single-strand DNA-binding protein
VNYNRIILIGRLTRDPELSYTPSGVPVTKFGLAVSRPQSAEARQQGLPEETDFFDVVAWRQLAENAANYLQKGRLVIVEGRMQIRDYVTNDGQRRKAAEVIADNFRNLQSKAESDAMGGGNGVGGGMGGNQDAGYEPAPAQAAPARPAAQARPAANGGGGGYDRGGAPAGGAGGGQARGGSGGGYDRPAGQTTRGRNTPPPANDPFADDDIADPFAE